MKAYVLGVAAILAGCASVAVERVPGPDGETALLLTCGDMPDCYREAARRCGDYEILDRGQESGTIKNGNPKFADINYTNHKMLVACQ